MADQQPVYTGATYNADIYKKPDESITDYMIRLSRLRSQGVLGGGGMLDTGPTPTVITPDAYSDETDLGVLKRNVQSSSSDGEQLQVAPRTYSQANNFGWIDPSTASNIGGLFGPLGSIIGRGLAEWNNTDAIKRAQDLAAIDEQNRTGTWFKDLIDSIGTKNINDRTYDVSLGGVIRDEPNFIESLFGMGKENITTSLTPAEANRRANMSLFQSRIPTAQAFPVDVINLPSVNPVATYASMDKSSSDSNSYAQSWGDAIAAQEANYDFQSEWDNF